MDVKKLIENVVTANVKYNGETIKLELKPDSLTTEDGSLPVSEFVKKALVSWDITVAGEPLEITNETLTNVIPSGVLTVIFDKILELKQASMGKLKVV